MNYSALIPYVVVLILFVIFRWSLIKSATIGVAVSLLLHSLIWADLGQGSITQTSLLTLQILFEIGFILVGAFFFIETAESSHIISSLAKLVREITPNRTQQGLMVSSSLALMVEGSSGFGTPLLVTIPILRALNFPLILCAVLPFINLVAGIPYGALGTPLRLGFGNQAPAYETLKILSPLTFVGLIMSLFLIRKFDSEYQLNPEPKTKTLKSIAFCMVLALTYCSVGLWVSHMGPEFPALAGGLASFLSAFIWIRLFEQKQKKQPIQHKEGILIYTSLLIIMLIGKLLFRDDLIPGTNVRIFNPGWVFITVALLINFYKHHAILKTAQQAVQRAWRTLWVLSCMTFMVQLVRNNGALNLLSESLPHMVKQEGALILGWLGSMLIGASTVTNMLLSKVIEPSHHALLAAGSSVGVQLAFQGIIATKSILKNQVTEAQLFKLIAPISVVFVIILSVLSTL